MPARTFPADFLWGVSTSAYQTEGNLLADGRGRSIWEDFVARPGAIEDGSDASRACDSYRRWSEDIDLIGEIGANAYRFSLAWCRIQPDGTGPGSAAGLDHYERIIDTLLGRGITPLITLYHWDLPAALQAGGGWQNRDLAARFADYADVCFGRFGDRVRDWVTICEPWILGLLGYQIGVHAPGIKDLPASVRVMHHLLLGHGLATQALQSRVPQGRAGVAFSLFPNYPATDRPEDVAAAALSEEYTNDWFLQPVLGHGYPERMREVYETRIGPFDFVQDGDFDTIATPSGFLGVNYYTRRIIAASDGDSLGLPWQVMPLPDDAETTDLGWEVVPHCLTDLLGKLSRNHPQVPLLITENGCVYTDAPGPDGRVRDDRRTSFLRRHLSAILDARQAGAPVIGYCHWSLLDNWEWAQGYPPRFGLVFVDYETGNRTIKDSAWAYRDIIRASEVPD